MEGSLFVVLWLIHFLVGKTVLCVYICIHPSSLQMLPSETVISEAPEINDRHLEGNWLLVYSSVIGKGYKKIGIGSAEWHIG